MLTENLHLYFIVAVNKISIFSIALILMYVIAVRRNFCSISNLLCFNIIFIKDKAFLAKRQVLWSELCKFPTTKPTKTKTNYGNFKDFSAGDSRLAW